MKIYNKQNIIDLLYGCTVLGTGGGGGLKEAFEMMQPDFDAGRELKVIDVADIPDDALIATPYGCGAPVPAEGAIVNEKFAKYKKSKESPAVLAFKSLEEYMGKKFFAVSSTELGGLNTAEALHIACLFGIPLADADPAGRSVPELQHSTYFIKNVSITPMGVATEFGDVVIVPKVVDDMRAEELVRAMAVASDDLVGVADHPTTGKIYRESVIVGAISYALKIGELLREGKENSLDIPSHIANNAEGKVLFRGVVSSAPWACVDGFDIGEIFIDGTGTDDGDKYKIWYKNENLISYKNGEIDVTCPDLICCFDKDGIPITNPDVKVGENITVIALRAPEIWKTPEGLACFGPKSFGFDVEYIPFQEKK